MNYALSCLFCDVTSVAMNGTLNVFQSNLKQAIIHCEFTTFKNIFLSVKQSDFQSNCHMSIKFNLMDLVQLYPLLLPRVGANLCFKQKCMIKLDH